MRGPRTIHCLLVAAIAAASPLAAGADPLAPIVEKTQLERADIATIETYVKQRVRRLVDAGKDADARGKAREAILETASHRKASQAGLTAYAEAVANEIVGTVLGTDVFETTLDAVLILNAIDNPGTATALAQSLHSRHAAVRYRAALGIKRQHAALAGDPSAVDSVLRALKIAGAKERDELVLRAIYEAVDFCSTVKDFNRAADVADALVEILGARISQLEGGSRDEWRDEAGIAAAAACYPKASAEQQKRLIVLVHRYQRVLADRYAARDIASEYLPTLRRLALACDRAINRMIQSSNAAPPSRGLVDAMKPRPSADAVKAVEAVVADYAAVLSKDPWKLP